MKKIKACLLWIVVLTCGMAMSDADIFTKESYGSFKANMSASSKANFTRQMSVFSEFKKSLTEAQAKIDSTLLLKKRVSEGDPIVNALSVPMVESLKETSGIGEMIDCDIRCKTSDRLVALIKNVGGKITSRSDRFGSIHAQIPMSSLEDVAEDADVKTIRQVVKPLLNRNTTSEGVCAHKADVARSTYGVTGAGVKVGVISDSSRYLSDLQASGDLPSGVTVLAGKSGILSNGEDTGEGTGMMEIVYDMAPGASIYFATSGNTESEMAENILALANAGCKVIVDDITFFREPVFQDGVITRAVNSVVDDGVVYFSSAANYGNLDSGKSSCWEGDYVCKNTDNAGDGWCAFGDRDNNPILSIKSSTSYIALNWSDPLGASANDYELYLLDMNTGSVIAKSTTTQNGDDDPIEFLSFSESQFRNYDLTVVVKNYHGNAKKRYLRLNAFGARLQVSTEGSTFGHNAAEKAISCAAASACGLSRPFKSSDTIESYSSDGPRRIFYTPTGAEVTPGNLLSTGGRLLQKPDVTAADDTASSWIPLEFGAGTFTGTSAAAPHAAGIAALMLEANPEFTRSDVMEVFKNATCSGENASWDRTYGYGILDAAECVRLSSQPISVATIPIELNVNGQSVQSEFVQMAGSWKMNTDLIPAWIKSVSAKSSATGVTYVMYANQGTKTYASDLRSLSFIVEAEENAGDDRNWEWNIIGQSGNTVCVLNVTQRGQPLTRPLNDNFANAIQISGMVGSVNGSNVNATEESGESEHGEVGSVNSVWWKWTAAKTGIAEFSTEGSSFDTGLSVYTGNSVAALNRVVGNGDVEAGIRWSKVTFPAVAGTTYRIAIGGYNGASGSIVLSWKLSEEDEDDGDKPYNLTATLTESGSVKLSCSYDGPLKWAIIYRSETSTRPSGKYDSTLISALKTSLVGYTDENTTAGKTYYYWVSAASSFNKVDETDVAGPVSITIPTVEAEELPDLTFQNGSGWDLPIFLSVVENAQDECEWTSEITSSDTVYFNVGIRNSGTVDCRTPFKTVFSVFDEYGEYVTGFDFTNDQSFQTIGAGEEGFQWRNREWALNMLEPGKYTLVCEIDGEDVVCEADEDNNYASFDFTVIEEIEERANLSFYAYQDSGVIAAAYLSKNSNYSTVDVSFSQGEDVYLTFGVCNVGAANVNMQVEHSLRLYDELGMLISENRQLLSPSASYAPLHGYVFRAKTWSSLQNLMPGQYRVTIEIDPDNKIAETRKDDNVSEIVFTVLPSIVRSVSLTVSSSYGEPEPAVGKYEYVEGAVVTATVDSVVLESTGKTRHVNTGWTGTGSVATSGPDNGTVFQLNDDSSITWNWQAEHKLTICTPENGMIKVATSGTMASTSWCQEGESKNLTAAPSAGYIFEGWTGDTDGCMISGNKITVRMSKPRTIGATFKPEQAVVPENGPFDASEIDDRNLMPTFIMDAVVSVEGELAKKNDVVAAYRMDNGVLCGVGRLLDDTGFLIMVMYAPKDVKIHFKVWQATDEVSMDAVRDADSSCDIIAPEPGSDVENIEIKVSGMEEQVISLSGTGWHLISFCVEPEDNSPASVFAEVSSKISRVSCGVEYWIPGKSGTLSAITVGKAYWVQTKEADVSWTVTGFAKPETELALKAGWTLVGYVPTVAGNVTEVLKSALAKGVITRITRGVSYFIPGRTSSLTTMSPGEAFWIQASEAATIKFDAVSTHSANSMVKGRSWLGSALNVEAACPFVFDPEVSMGLEPTFIEDAPVSVYGRSVVAGDYVAAYRADTGKLCGMGPALDDSGLVTFVMYAPQGAQISFKIWSASENRVYDVDASCNISAPDPNVGVTGIPLTVTKSDVTPVEGVTIPRSEVEDFMAKYPTLAAQAGSDPDAFAAMPSVTGKLDENGNQMYVWQDIIAGTDPTNPDDKFKIVDIKFEDGELKITWSPDLNEGGKKNVRAYTEFGRKELGTSEEWTNMKDVNPAEKNDYKFRKVTVDMP